MIDLLVAVLVSGNKPLCPALVLESFLEGLAELGFSELDGHGPERAQRKLVDVLQVFLILFLFDFLLKDG